MQPPQPLRLERVAPGRLQERALALLDEAAAGRVARAALVHAAPALVLGSGQASETIDEAACRRDGVVVVRRGSGGGAVLCDETLLEIDVALPAGHPLAIADVTASYAWLGGAWCTALATLGVAARTATLADARGGPPERAAAGRVACFASLVPHEVVTADGRKVVGLAQRRRRGAVLLQCAVACAVSPAAVLRYVRLPTGLEAACSEALAATACLAALGGPSAPDPVVGAIAAAVDGALAQEAARPPAGRHRAT